MPILAALLLMQTDPMRLPIGTPGEITVRPGQMVSTVDGHEVNAQDIAKSARSKKWVFLGENHATAHHQNLHAAVIKALVDDGRTVFVGMEMMTRPKQSALDAWVQGDLMRTQFIDKGEWKTQWGYPFSFYEPIFEVCRENKVPMVALNVPRDWVRNVGKSGFAGLDAAAKAALPAEMTLDNKDHRSVFTALMGGHPMTGPRGENVYSAQVLWDEGMADTAIKYMSKIRDSKAVFVVLAGSGHVMYRQGINYRVNRRLQDEGVTVVMGQATGPIQVSKGIGDFVFISPEAK